MDFSGRVALITGGGKGLGRAFAQGLARRGASVVVNNRSRDGQDSAGDVVASLSAEGCSAIANRDSVEEPGAAQRMVTAACQAFGRLDIVIANAAVAERERFARSDFDDFRRVVDIDLLAPAELAHTALPVMADNSWGRLLFVTSGAGLYGEFGVASYSTAKAGLRGLARTITLENAGRGIVAHELAPYALTQMTEGFVDDALAARMDPEQVVPAALWLVSEEAPGHTVTVVAGGGRFRRAEVMESPTIGFDHAVGDEDFCAQSDALFDEGGWQTFPDAMVSFRDLMGDP